MKRVVCRVEGYGKIRARQPIASYVWDLVGDSMKDRVEDRVSDRVAARVMTDAKP